MHSAPLLLLSAPGAEAARLGAMLGRHPDAYGLPELNLHLAPTVDGLLSVFRVTQDNAQDGLLRCVAELYCGGQDEAAIAAAEAWLKRRADWPSMDLLSEFAQHIAPGMPVLSESALGWRLLDIEGWLAQVPEARVLHLVRHPRPQCREVAARLKGPFFVPPDYKDYGVDPPAVDPQLAWYRINRNIEQAVAGLPAVQRRQLRVEDLYLAAEDTLQSICAWLGLRCDATALRRMLRPEDSPYSHLGPAVAPFGMEPGMQQAPEFVGRLPPRQELEGALEWRSDGKPFAAEVVALAHNYGYR
ncbi:MAG: sulfotransferase [Nevskia sp.]|nr:sulfotransferase [Nevskia sp.]